MGVKSLNDDSSLGRFGLSHINESGKRMLSYVAIQELKVITTCFKKRRYSTWVHPCSKNFHQIDHMLVNREMFVRCINAGITSPLLVSDNNATYLTLRLMKRLKKKCDNRQRLIALDHSSLLEHNVKNYFLEMIKNNINIGVDCKYSDLSEAMTKAASAVLLRRGKAQPDWFKKMNKILTRLSKQEMRRCVLFLTEEHDLLRKN